MSDPWLACNRWTLRTADEGTRAEWTFELGAGDDLRLAIDEERAGARRRGELLVVGGRILLARGLGELPAGHELDEVDHRGLTLQLARSVLARLVPGGLAAVDGELTVEREETEPIEVATLSGASAVPAPWHAVARLRRRGAASVGFELELRHGIGSPLDGSTRLDGTGEICDPPPALDDAMSLDGWQVFRIGARHDGGTLDVGAHPAGPRADTLGRLRG